MTSALVTSLDACFDAPLVLPSDGLRTLLKTLVHERETQNNELRRLSEEMAALKAETAKEHEQLRRAQAEATGEAARQLSLALRAAREEVDQMKKQVREQEVIVADLRAAQQQHTDAIAVLRSSADQQREWNAVRSAEGVAFREKFRALDQHLGLVSAATIRTNATFASLSASPVPAARETPIRRTNASTHHDYSDMRSLAVEEGASVGDVATLRSQLDDLVRLLGTTSMQIQAALATPPSERVRFLHGLPVFHAIWAELFRLQNGVQPGDPACGLNDPRPTAIATQRPAVNDSDTTPRTPLSVHAAPPPHAASPDNYSSRGLALLASTPRSTSAAAPITTGNGASMFIPGLGADVGPRVRVHHRSLDRHTTTSGAERGVLVHRIVTGGTLARNGVAAGDGVDVHDGEQLADLVERLPPEHQPLITVMPHARAVSTPLTVRLATASPAHHH
jgi:hypothetical protein